MSAETCPVCGNQLSVGYSSWHLLCGRCAYERADFQPAINLDSAHRLIDEPAREKGIRELRIGNFRKLLAHIKSLKPGGGRLLDVGCAHGWFLEAARNDFDVLGLEPDRSVFETTSRRGLSVRLGYFPGLLDESQRFDVIVFNYVIEHIPDIEGILASCRRQLNDDGVLVLNLPSSAGVFYRLSKIFCRLGYPGFFERLWQKNLHSPHLHYFSPSNLVALLQSRNFDVQDKGRLATLRLDGLYTRVSYIDTLGFIGRVIVCIGAALSLPPIAMLPSDIFFVIATPRRTPS
jgi:2-polyprenyl-3-methyl-5-hydroxy-6-metoxy-1,4-benzoquinol methylase